MKRNNNKNKSKLKQKSKICMSLNHEIDDVNVSVMNYWASLWFDKIENIQYGRKILEE